MVLRNLITKDLTLRALEILGITGTMKATKATKEVTRAQRELPKVRLRTGRRGRKSQTKLSLQNQVILVALKTLAFLLRSLARAKLLHLSLIRRKLRQGVVLATVRVKN
jgi:hypothetical protein